MRYEMVLFRCTRNESSVNGVDSQLGCVYVVIFITQLSGCPQNPLSNYLCFVLLQCVEQID